MPSEAWLAVVLVGALALVAGMVLGQRVARQAERRASAAAPGIDTPARSSADLRDRLEPADHLGIGLLRVDHDDLIVGANQTAERMLGASAGSLERRSAIAAFVDHNAENLIRRARRHGNVSGELRQPSDPQRTLVVHAWPSTADAVWVALEDVSELRQLRRIRAEFIDNLAHELRTPVTTMRLLAETLAMDADRTELPPRLRDSIAKIDVETDHLAQMINEILDLSRIEGGASEMRFGVVDVDALIGAAIERLRTFAERQGVSLLVEDIGRDEPLLVRADEERLAQVLINLLHNAVKFSSTGSSVRVSATSAGEMAVVSVADDGVGIPRADLSRVFERFYKVDRARHRGHGGTGLGLAIARHIVEGHGGKIRVESVEGRGSTFSFTVPLVGQNAATAPAPGSATP